MRRGEGARESFARAMNVLRKRASGLDFATVALTAWGAATDMGERGEIERALRGDGIAVRALVDRLTPAIQSAVARVLLRSGARLGRDVRSDVADLTQEVFERLFADDGRVLREWDPARGAQLEGFAKIVAERHALSALRSRRRSPFAEEPREAEALERGGETTERWLVERDLLHEVCRRLKSRLSAQGMRAFELLFVEEREVEVVGEALGISRDAVYMWRTRIRQTAREVALEVGESRSGAAKPAEGAAR